MFTKKLVIFLLFALKFVPGYLRPDVCPKHSDAEQCQCDYCQKALVPIIESRLSDQKPYSHQYTDSSSEDEEQYTAYTFNKSEESSTADLAGRKELEIEGLNIGDEFKSFERFADLSSEEQILRNKSQDKLWNKEQQVTSQFFTDALASSELTANKKSVLDTPLPTIETDPEENLSLPVKAEDIIKMEIKEADASSTPTIDLESVALKPDSYEDHQIEDLEDIVQTSAFLMASGESSTASLINEDNKDRNSIRKVDVIRKNTNKHRSRRPFDSTSEEDKSEELESKKDKMDESESDEKIDAEMADKIGARVFQDILDTL